MSFNDENKETRTSSQNAKSVILNFETIREAALFQIGYFDKPESKSHGTLGSEVRPKVKASHTSPKVNSKMGKSIFGGCH